MHEKPLRILTAVAAYDGHDASVLALNRALLAGARPVEVIYLGFNMTGEKIAAAALQEGADAVAVSSYNGGHLQFFPHLVTRLAEKGMGETLVFGGGGGTILPADASAIEAAGVAKIYGPGWPLDSIAADLVERTMTRAAGTPEMPDPARWQDGKPSSAELSRLLSLVEAEARQASAGAQHPAAAAGAALAEVAAAPSPAADRLRQWLARGDGTPAMVVAITGDGGSGKSTLIDELVRRFLASFPEKKVAILANDPTTVTKEAATAFLADRVRQRCRRFSGCCARPASTWC